MLGTVWEITVCCLEQAELKPCGSMGDYVPVPGTLSGLQEFPSIDAAMVGKSPAAIHSSGRT